MKFSTRARYGLRMMVELARELQDNRLVHLGKVSEVTGISGNYLSQLAISLKNNRLIVGVPGKKGGFHLTRNPSEISVGEIVEALIGPISMTDCVTNPDICNNSVFCESRAVWSIVNARVQEILEEIKLSDLIDRNWLNEMREKNPEMTLLFPDTMMSQMGDESVARSLSKGCGAYCGSDQ